MGSASELANDAEDKPKAKMLLLEAREIGPESEMAKNIDRILASDPFKIAKDAEDAKEPK